MSAQSTMAVPRLEALTRARAAVERRDFAAAVAALADGGEMTDARARYSLGICHFGVGRRDEGLQLIVSALKDSPGLFPYWPLPSVLDTLREIDAALSSASNGAPSTGDGSPSVDGPRLTVRLAIAEALAQTGRAEEAAPRFVDIIRAARPVNLLAAAEPIDVPSVRALVAPQPIWHSMDLTTGFVEGQRKTSRVLATEILRFGLPDLRGKTVLDIGAWDGFFSFECERRGAARVTALDYHSWVTDLAALSKFAVQYKQEHQKMPDLYAPPERMQDHDALPGRRAFETTRRLLGSRVEPVCQDFRTVDPSRLGVFDTVLFLGVLYHLTDPFAALSTLNAITGEMAIIETLGIHDPANEGQPIWEFCKDDRVNNDPTTWWMPNERGLTDMLEAAGFRRVSIVSGVNTLDVLHLSQRRQLRIVAHAWK